MVTITSPVSGSSREFKRCEACLVLGDPLAEDVDLLEDGLVVAAEDEGGTITVLHELRAKHSDMIEKLVDIKDRWGVSALYVHVKHPRQFREIAEIDGLSHYAWSHRDKLGRAIYLSPDVRIWKHHRGRDHTAHVLPVWQSVASDLQTAYSVVHKRSVAGTLAIWFSQCPLIQRAGQQPPHNAIQAPIFQAYLMLIAVMSYSSDKGITPLSASHPQHWGWNDFNIKEVIK